MKLLSQRYDYCLHENHNFVRVNYGYNDKFGRMMPPSKHNTRWIPSICLVTFESLREIAMNAWIKKIMLENWVIKSLGYYLHISSVDMRYTYLGKYKLIWFETINILYLYVSYSTHNLNNKYFWLPV